jgi:hypothetical protein
MRGPPMVNIYLIVADPDAYHERTRAADAEIVRGLTDQDYGSREYGARDLEGNLCPRPGRQPLAVRRLRPIFVN